jgi:hypothetical protein
MPIVVRYDEANHVLFRELTGTVTADDIRQSWSGGLPLPSGVTCYRQLSDIRRARLTVTGADLRAALHDLVKPALRPGRYFTAIVAEPGAQFGIARQMSAFTEGVTLTSPGVTIQTEPFTDYDAAVAWLLHQSD